MRAIRIHEFGGPEVLTLEDIPTPQPGPDEVLVRVRGAGINPYEAYIREGRYTFLPPRPFTLGGEGAGDIVAVGENVKQWHIGDAVWGYLKGSHADYAVADAALIYPKPDRLSYHEAAGLTTVCATAVIGLVILAEVHDGETVFISGATGGVGSIGVQIAAAFGARVIAAVGSEEKAALARELGADTVIVYTQGSLEEALRAAAPEGIHVTFDGVGKPVFVPAIRNMASGGRYVLYGGSGGRDLAFEAPEFYRRNLSLIGFSAASHPRTPESRRWMRDELVLLLASGRVRAIVAKAFPLAETADAYRYLASRAAQGKVILDPTLDAPEG
ncbi:MAG: NADPH:quinone oxidoreductase family protein [Anaerolineae bacterium]